MATDDPLRFLRRCHAGVLRVGETIHRVKYVLDPRTGHPVASVPGGAEDAEDVSLLIPDEGEDSLQLHVEPVFVDQRTDEACDRWLIYHGQPRESRFARLTIQTARLAGRVYDQIAEANLLRGDEPRLVKAINAHPAALAQVCLRAAGAAPEAPLLVGVDPHGLDVKTRFGILRVEFPSHAKSAEDVRRRIDEMTA